MGDHVADHGGLAVGAGLRHRGSHSPDDLDIIGGSQAASWLAWLPGRNSGTQIPHCSRHLGKSTWELQSKSGQVYAASVAFACAWDLVVFPYEERRAARERQDRRDPPLGRQPGAILFLEWCPAHLMQRETSITTAVFRIEVPAPEYHGSVIVGSRQGFVYQRIQGSPLLGLMTSSPLQIACHVRVMADHQSRTRRQKGSASSSRREWLRTGIREAGSLGHSLRDFACTVLDDLPDGTTACRFFFHPDQRLVAAHGPVVLVWMNAFRGDPQVGVARASILLTVGDVAHLAWATRVLVGVTRRKINGYYLKHYLDYDAGTSPRAGRKGMILVAAARMNEMRKGEEDAIMHVLEIARSGAVA